MKKMLKTLAITASGFLLLAGAASAAEGQKDAKAISYSFEGPFGTFDKGELQRATRFTRKSAQTAIPCGWSRSAI